VITGMFHTGLTVGSLDAAMAFYGDTLGIENTHTQVSDQPYLAGVTGLPGCSLLIGFARIEGDPLAFELLQYVRPTGTWAGAGFGRVGSLNAAWAVDDVSAIRDRLVAQGVRVLAEPHAVRGGPLDGGTSSLFLDPDGLTVELFEPSVSASQIGRLTGLHHTTLVVSDLDAACEALTGGLGLELTDRYEGESETARQVGAQDAHVRIASLAIPGTSHVLQLLSFRTPVGPPARPAGNNLGSGHLCLVVEDLVATYEALSERGIRFVGRPTEVTAGINKGARAAYLVGPDEIRFELFQRP
jgi:lactoylglutathione lyase